MTKIEERVKKCFSQAIYKTSDLELAGGLPSATVTNARLLYPRLCHVQDAADAGWRVHMVEGVCIQPCRNLTKFALGYAGFG